MLERFGSGEARLELAGRREKAGSVNGHLEAAEMKEGAVEMRKRAGSVGHSVVGEARQRRESARMLSLQLAEARQRMALTCTSSRLRV